MFSYYVSFRSELRVVMSVTISAYIQRSVPLYLQLCVGEIMSYLRHLCLLRRMVSNTYSVVLFVLLVVVLCLVYPRLLVSLDCPCFIAPSAFSTV